MVKEKRGFSCISDWSEYEHTIKPGNKATKQWPWPRIE